MKDVDYSYLGNTVANLSGVPVRIYKNKEMVQSFPDRFLPKDPVELYKNEILAETAHVGYYITPRFYLYGILNSGDTAVVTGPTTQVPAGDQSLRELAFQLGVPKEDTQDFVDGMKNIVPMPLESLLLMLCALNYPLNGEKLQLQDIAIQSDRQEALKANVEKRRTERVYSQEPPRVQHNTLQIEETMTDIVRRGDTAALRQWLSSAPAVRGGVIASEQLRQLKNTFIVTATLVSRAAIRGGLDTDDSLALSDAYIQRAETLHAQSELINLQYNMVLEFTEQVEKIRRGRSPSKLAADVANYVQHHLSERISTEELARELFMSRTHLSAKFKKETGQTLTDFILNEKTEEAKRLLRYSDRSASDISAYLGFSGGGHFARVFKKYSGLTPNEYREKHSRI